MPPKWSRKPDRNDPEYRRLGDRINLAFHVAFFSALNSGAWFFAILYRWDLPWLTPVTGTWGAVLVAHAIYVLALADYSESA